MGSSNIRDILTAFSPSRDFFAINTGDGRIKIWNTVNGQVQTEFTDMVRSEESESLLPKLDKERGHLSIDYTCMKWFSLETKKKRKLGSTLLMLGTGGGDVLALDVSAGHLKWRLRDCHPGGVSAVSCATKGASVYTAGRDGMVCEIDSLTGNFLGKFKASTKAISSVSVSPDGKIIATAAGQLKTFNSSDHKRTHKFSGHAGNVRCLIFSEDGKYILSSAIGDRYVAIWNLIDSGKKQQSAICALAMDHPAVFIDSKFIFTKGGDNDSPSGIYVLAVSEAGVCYFWFGKNMEELRNASPTKISVSLSGSSASSIFAAMLHGPAKPDSGSGQVFAAHGLLAKPTFQKVLVNFGTDVLLSGSLDGILLPANRSLIKSKKGREPQSEVIALDRANAEDALLLIPKVLDYEEKSEMVTEQFSEIEDGVFALEVDTKAVCLEDRMRSLGLLSKKDNISSKSKPNSAILGGISFESVTPKKKMKEIVLSKSPSEAYKLLGVLVTLWQSGSCSGKYVLPWIYNILINHSRCVMSEEPVTQTLNSLLKVCKSRGSTIKPLLQLSGRLQLVMAQIDKSTQPKTPLLREDSMNESDEEEVDDVIYKEDESGSEISSDDDKS